MDETGYYAVTVGRKPGIYKKRVDAILQTKNFPYGYFRKFETIELAYSYLKNSQDELSFYAVKIGRIPGIYTRNKDAIKQTFRFSGSLVKKFKTFEEAQSFLKEPVKKIRKPSITTERECVEKQAMRFSGTRAKNVNTAVESAPLLHKPFVNSDNNIVGTRESPVSPFEEAQTFLKEPVKHVKKFRVSTERECIENQAKHFSGTHAKNVDTTVKIAQPILNKSFVNSDNNIVGTGDSPVSEFSVSKLTSKLSNECSDAFEYVSKPPKHKMDDESTFYLVLKRLKVDESGRYMPVVRYPDESVVVFAWGGRLGKGVNSKVAIGVYWGPNHPLNVSRKITGEQTVARAKKYAVVLALYQTKQIKAVTVTLYCNWRLISEVTQKVKCFKNKALKDKVSLITLCLIEQGIDVKYQYVKPKHEAGKGHIGKHGISEAKKLAIAACNLSLSTENIILEFENVRNELNNSLNELLAPVTKLSSNKDDAKQSILTGKVKCSSQMDLLTPLTKLNNNEDDAKQFVLAGQLNKSAQIELLTSNAEVSTSTNKNYAKQFVLNSDVSKSAQVKLSVKNEENRDEAKQHDHTDREHFPESAQMNESRNNVKQSASVDELSKNSQIELIVPKSEVIDEAFTNVFICGRSFISDSQRAGIGIYWSPDYELNTSLRLLGQQMNSRAEIWAATHAFLQAKQLNLKNVCVYTDSEFVIKEIMTYLEKYKLKNWEIGEGFPIIYKEDVKSLDKAMTGLKVKWCHVMERNSSLGFIEAERLAVSGCNKIAVE